MLQHTMFAQDMVLLPTEGQILVLPVTTDRHKVTAGTPMCTTSPDTMHIPLLLVRTRQVANMGTLHLGRPLKDTPMAKDTHHLKPVHTRHNHMDHLPLLGRIPRLRLTLSNTGALRHPSMRRHTPSSPAHRQVNRNCRHNRRSSSRRRPSRSRYNSSQGPFPQLSLPDNLSSSSPGRSSPQARPSCSIRA